jgi:hypothetical protein
MLAERFNQLDFGVFELDESHCHAMPRQGQGPALLPRRQARGYASGGDPWTAMARDSSATGRACGS